MNVDSDAHRSLTYPLVDMRTDVLLFSSSKGKPESFGVIVVRCWCVVATRFYIKIGEIHRTIREQMLEMGIVQYQAAPPRS